MKYMKLFENFDFIQLSKDKYKRILDEVKDILLELSDNDIRYQINKYIDDMIFELQIYITHIETKKQKAITEDVIFRLNQFLQEYDLNIQKIVYQQQEFPEHEKSPIKVKYLYDLDEINNLQDSAGPLTISLVFGEHSY